jgi:hypothetical protein
MYGEYTYASHDRPTTPLETDSRNPEPCGAQIRQIWQSIFPSIASGVRYKSCLAAADESVQQISSVVNHHHGLHFLDTATRRSNFWP